MNKLEAILARTRADLGERKSRVPLAELKARCADAPPVRGFAAAVKRGRLIAEVKRRSPSAGAINEGLDPATLAKACEAGGAAAISVLTDGPHFGGSIDDLIAVRNAVKLPVMRKDFIVDEYQLYESRAAGADGVLLIVAALNTGELVDLAGLARQLKLDTLAEMLDRNDLERSERLSFDLVGINNRDLRTFVTNLETTESLSSAFRGDFFVSESGVRGPADVLRLARAGASAFLVGEALSGAADPESATRAISRALAPLRFPFKQAAGTQVKICGITSVADALMCVEAGADAIGCVLEPTSKRAVTHELLAAVAAAVRGRATVAAVYDRATFFDIESAGASGATIAQAFTLVDYGPVAGLTDPGGQLLPVILGQRVSGPESLAGLNERARGARAVLLDGPEGGGRGKPFELALAESVSRSTELPLVIAGGLDAHNVGALIKVARPAAVDVATGTEKSPGVKDPAKVRAFIAAVRAAAAELK